MCLCMQCMDMMCSFLMSLCFLGSPRRWISNEWAGRRGYSGFHSKYKMGRPPS